MVKRKRSRQARLKFISSCGVLIEISEGGEVFLGNATQIDGEEEDLRIQQRGKQVYMEGELQFMEPGHRALCWSRVNCAG